MSSIKKMIVSHPSLWMSAAKVGIMRKLGLRSTTVRTHGIRMRANLAKGKGIWCSIGGLYYEPEMRALIGLLHEGDVFVDVGANVGIYSLHAARATGSSGRVIAFEPTPETHESLLKNIQLNRVRNITVINKAAGDKEGLLQFAICASDNSNHLVADLEMLESRKIVEIRDIPVDTIDTMAVREKLPHVSVMKIDAEGAEKLVLAGATHVIKTHRPTILFESCDAGNGSPDRVFLTQLGYRLFRLDDGRWTDDVAAYTGNILGIARPDHFSALGIQSN